MNRRARGVMVDKIGTDGIDGRLSSVQGQRIVHRKPFVAIGTGIDATVDPITRKNRLVTRELANRSVYRDANSLLNRQTRPTFTR